jgi:hypothetical protein
MNEKGVIIGCLRYWICIFISISILAIHLPAHADSPFYTDDPLFSPGWEIKGGITGEHNFSGSLLTEVLDWNYAFAIVPYIRLNLTTFTKHIWTKDGQNAFGYGETEFKVKWRFLEENMTGFRPALGIAPKVFFPTSDEDRGLGDGIWRFQLPLQLGKTLNRCYLFTEAGYQWAFDKSVSNVLYAGCGTLYAFTDHFSLGIELFGTAPITGLSSSQVLSTVGMVYTFNKYWSIKGSLSHTLRETTLGGPNPSGVFYIVWNY